MSDTHEVNIVRVGPILPHPNADKLQLTMVGGYQVVIGKDNFREGDFAVYIQPDSVVPQTEPFRFIWGPHCFETPVTDDLRKRVESSGQTLPPETAKLQEIVPEKRRRITVKRLRREYSEGLLMPTRDFPQFDARTDDKGNIILPAFTEGQNVADLLGVTRYVPEFDAEKTKAGTVAAPKRKYPKTLKGWFYFVLTHLGFKRAGRSLAQEVSFVFPEYDVNALKNARRVTFRDGELVTVTEKIHGSNARFVFIPDGTKPNPLNPAGKFYVGSHRQWKLEGDNVWWKALHQHPFIEEWCYQHPGQVLYAEVGPTQKGYRYGAGEGETFVFPFDAFDPQTNEWSWPDIASTAPVLYVGPYDKDIMKQFIDGPSVVPGAKTDREGIVIHSRERRLKLKVVSNKFYEGDSK